MSYPDKPAWLVYRTNPDAVMNHQPSLDLQYGARVYPFKLNAIAFRFREAPQ
jgi:hypothetical protein